MLAALPGSDSLQRGPGGGLSVRGVRKRFRNVEVLRGIDFDVAPGEVVALLGANGAGKSTLLRIIVGTVTADMGHVSVGGHDIHGDPRGARAAVSWVLGDEHGWYWRLSGFENLVFFAMLRGIPRRDAADRADAELVRQGLDRARDQRVGEYSTGMRARLALARASVAPTATMVLDEPGRGLDIDASEELEEFLKGPTSTAVLLVTHTLDLVERVAHRSLVLKQGVIAEELPAGTPASVLATNIGGRAR
jgi:ABC-2 type transport system ATP-binding protein